MSQPLELPDDIFSALEQAAAESGTTPVGWIAAHLPPQPQEPPANGAKTLADLFAGRIGRIHSGGREALSEECGQKFAEHLEQKRREGRL